jgi:hypothetical protein
MWLQIVRLRGAMDDLLNRSQAALLEAGPSVEADGEVGVSYT